MASSSRQGSWLHGHSCGSRPSHHVAHSRVTEDTLPENWRGNSYKVPNIQQVFVEYLEYAMPMGLSERQMEAHAFFTQMLTQDAHPQNAYTPIGWARDEPEVTKHLDAMFFKGLLRRSGRVRYAVKPEGLDRANLHFGLTEYEGDGGTVKPSFETQESDVAGVHTRIQKRSRARSASCATRWCTRSSTSTAATARRAAGGVAGTGRFSSTSTSTATRGRPSPCA
ncbi:hypothetical protein PGQ11_006211 [Apiospora arundinis]|uniref:Uncharacterized protein n=1 Tax=Apiospora arundinis TaxID=335852 RepID=A0ABR2ISH8_9PEZI